MKRTRIMGIAALVLGMLQSATAYSVVTGSLVFRDPTGVVNASDTIDVWVTLTLDATSAPLVFNSSDSYPNGVDPNDIPTEAYSFDQSKTVPFASYEYISAFVSRTCNDTFTVGCSDPGSQYSYTSYSDAESWFGFSGTINAGESRDFKVYKLAPSGGSAAPGTYSLFTTGIGLTVNGLDADGNTLSAEFNDFYTNCGASNCTFTRTVSSVPVPAAAWLFGSGLLGLIGVSRRKHAA